MMIEAGHASISSHPMAENISVTKSAERTPIKDTTIAGMSYRLTAATIGSMVVFGSIAGSSGMAGMISGAALGGLIGFCVAKHEIAKKA